MEQDPGDPGRLGFHLACGWSGVADLLAGSTGARPRTLPVPSSPTRTVPPPPGDGRGRHGTSRRGGLRGGDVAPTVRGVGPTSAGQRRRDGARRWNARDDGSDDAIGPDAHRADARIASIRGSHGGGRGGRGGVAMGATFVPRAENGDAEANAAAPRRSGALNADVDDDFAEEAAARRRRRARRGRRWPDEPVETSGHVLSVAALVRADQIVAGSWGPAVCWDAGDWGERERRACGSQRRTRRAREFARRAFVDSTTIPLGARPFRRRHLPRL